MTIQKWQQIKFAMLELCLRKTLLHPAMGMEALELAMSIRQPYSCPGIETLSLADIRSPHRKNKYCCLLVSIKSVKPEVITNGRRVREVKVFDDTSDTGILKLWEPEQLRMAETWEPRNTILLLSNVLIEWDKYWGIAVLSGSSRSVITMDPYLHDARLLRREAYFTPFSSSNRLNVFVLGNLASTATDTTRRLTVAEIRKLGERGVDCEASALTFVSVLASITAINLRDQDAVTPRCLECSQLVVPFSDCVFECENFDCQITADTKSYGPITKYSMRATVTDPTGSLTDLPWSDVFLVEALGDPERWPTHTPALKKTVKHLVTTGFVEIFLALEIPLFSRCRPLRIMIVSAR